MAGDAPRKYKKTRVAFSHVFVTCAATRRRPERSSPLRHEPAFSLLPAQVLSSLPVHELGADPALCCLAALSLKARDGRWQSDA